MQHISVNDLHQQLESEQAAPVLIDVREPWEFERCHIAGSQLIPMRKIPETVDKLNPDQQTVVICHTGMRSHQVCLFLEHSGFSQVLNLTGGVHAWARQIDNTMETY